MDNVIDKLEYRERLLRAIEDYHKGYHRPPESRSATQQPSKQPETRSMRNENQNSLWY